MYAHQIKNKLRNLFTNLYTEIRQHYVKCALPQDPFPHNWVLGALDRHFYDIMKGCQYMQCSMCAFNCHTCHAMSARSRTVKNRKIINFIGALSVLLKGFEEVRASRFLFISLFVFLSLSLSVSPTLFLPLSPFLSFSLSLFLCQFTTMTPVAQKTTVKFWKQYKQIARDAF